LAPDLDPDEPRPSDALYGVGAVLAECLTGRPVIQGKPFAVLARAVAGEIELPLPEPYRSVVRGLLQTEGHRRPASAKAAREAIESLASGPFERGEPLPVVPISVPEEPVRAESRPADQRSLRFVEVNAAGLEVWVREPAAVRMVLLPGGPVRLGSLRGKELGRDNESPTVEVTVEPFLIDEAPVTWKSLTDVLPFIHPSHPLVANRETFLPKRYGGTRSEGEQQGRWAFEKAIVVADDQPVIMVTYAEAAALGRSLGAELPSEAEWEYAYRAGTTTEYWWGETWESTRGWCSDEEPRGPQPVRQKEPNPFGLHDMAGNVSEFCRDRFHKDAYERCASGTDPDFTATRLAAGIEAVSPRRSIRNGNWRASSRAMRAAFRAGVEEDSPLVTVGFRFVIRESRAPEWAREPFEKE
jgi:formylglycine-generating enzyme required for sulfatase activity